MKNSVRFDKGRQLRNYLKIQAILLNSLLPLCKQSLSWHPHFPAGLQPGSLHLFWSSEWNQMVCSLESGPLFSAWCLSGSFMCVYHHVLPFHDRVGSHVGCTPTFFTCWKALIFPTQGSNLGLPYCRQNLYHLSHQGSLWVLPTCWQSWTELLLTSCAGFCVNLFAFF